MSDGIVGRLDGLILLLGLVLYLLYLLQMAKKGQAVIEEEEKSGVDESLWKLLVMIVGGGVLIVWGSNITVDAATELARIFGMSERLIGLTIVAFGTSLPELVTSVTQHRRQSGYCWQHCRQHLQYFICCRCFQLLHLSISGDFLVDSVVCALTAVLLWLCVFARRNGRESVVHLC